MISVSAINPLAGLDQLLHGSDNLKGWGQPNRADPTLLYVSGFDPINKRFIYTVNDRFGDNPASRAAIRTPFQLALQARLQVGPDRQRELLEGTSARNQWQPARRVAAVDVTSIFVQS